MKSVWLKIIGSFLLFAGAHAEEPVSPEIEAQSIKVVEQAVDRVNDMLAQDGFSKIRIEGLAGSGALKLERLRKIKTIRLGGFKASVEVELLPDSLSIYSLTRSDFFRENHACYKNPPKPEWPESRAILTAEKFAKAVLGNTSVQSGKPTARFQTQMDLPNYNDGRWSVIWPRVSKKGYPFVYDGMRVVLTEKFGPVYVSCNFYSNYVEGDFEPIPKERAMEEAPRRVKEMMEWSPARMRFLDFALGTSTAELKIVNPQYITEQSSVEALAFARDANARLAWVVTYKTSYAGPREGKQGIPLDGEIQVWFDAESGKYLGGDFK